jgi:hypothetical protein
MTFPMPTDTAHVRLRTRMFRLFSVDLGEGVERSTLKVFAGFFIPWLLLIALIGVSPMQHPYAYLLPPLFVTFRACSRDAGGRVRLRGWIDKGMSRHTRKPIVNADTAPAAPPAVITADVAFLVVDEIPVTRKARRAQAAR